MQAGDPAPPNEPRGFANLGWCDLSLRSLAWVEGGRDLELTFLRPESAKSVERARIVRATWVGALQVSLEFPPNAGRYPLTWHASFERREDDERWSVEFDFAEDGRIAFQCSELSVVDYLEPSPTTTEGSG